MKVFLSKFGTTLTSRQLGKECLAAYWHKLSTKGDNEKLELDFMGVNTFSPSWGDEFITPLVDQYGEDVVFLNTEQNLSVKETLKLLQEISHKSFTILS